MTQLHADNSTHHIYVYKYKLQINVYAYSSTSSVVYKVPNDLCPLSVYSVSLTHSLHLNPVSGASLEGGQSVGGVTVGRLGDIDGAILGGVGHSKGVALGVAGYQVTLKVVAVLLDKVREKRVMTYLHVYSC